MERRSVRQSFLAGGEIPGPGTHTYRVSISRWYQDREGLWKNSSTLYAEDLPRLGELVAECVRKFASL